MSGDPDSKVEALPNGGEAVPVDVSESDKPKERIKKPQRPDDVAHKQTTEALQATINKNKARVEEIKQALDDKRKGRGAGSTEQQAIKSKLSELRGQFQALLKQKLHLREQLDVASKTRDAVRNSLRELKSNMKFTTVEAIDDAIDKLEHRVQHSSLSLNEEKKVLDDIRKLKASRSAVGEYSEKLEALAQDDSSRGELQAGIKALDEELNKIKAKEDTLRAELTAQREKDQENASDVPALLQEREECREVCKQAYEKIKDLRAEHDVVWQEFKAQDKIWRAQQDEERAERRKQAAADRAIRDAERAARLAEMAPEPFDKEITMCDQLTAYLNRFVIPNQVSVAENAAAQDSGSAVAALEGMKVYARSNAPAEDDDLGSWMAGNSGKRGNKGKGKKSSGEKSASSAPEKLVHSLDMLDAFATLRISVPTSAVAVGSVLTEVDTKKQEYLKMREEAKLKGGAEENKEDAAEAEASNISAANPGQPGEGEPGVGGAGKKKASKKGAASPAALKLDDVASWPAVGTAPGSMANGDHTPAADEAADEAAEEVVSGEVPVSASEPAVSAEKNTASSNGVAIEFKIEDGDGVSLSISHSDD